LRIRYVQPDRDGKFREAFDATLRKHRVTAVPGPPQAPNTQSFVERFIGSIRRECLDHFVFFGTEHFDRVARSWLEHYHAERPPDGRENKLLIRPPGKQRSPTVTEGATFSLCDVRCGKRFGGLLMHFERVAPNIVSPACSGDFRCRRTARRRQTFGGFSSQTFCDSAPFLTVTPPALFRSR
jgi:hypothetical protein